MGTVTRRFLRAFIALLCCFVGTSAHAQFQGSAKITVVERLTLVKTADLEFGTLMAGPTAGTVIISTASARSTTGGVTAAGGTFHAAEFSGYGARNQQISITFPQPSILITRVGGTQTMTVYAFTPNPVVGSGLQQLGNSGRHRINHPTGIFEFTVGGRMNVNANQMPGTYVGQFSVTVNYQ